MTPNDVLFFTSWFENYTKGFNSKDIEIETNLRYKREHSLRVRDYMIMIGHDLQLETNHMLLAELLGLFHDIGRFEQYSKYHTFKDHLSVDHALLGLSVLKREGIFSGRLNEREQEIIRSAIKNHNQRVIQDTLHGITLTFCRLIRDADKLDILDQIISFYENPWKTPYLAVENNHADKQYSPEIIEGILNGKQIAYTSVKTPADIKLIRLSWLLDLTFSTSLKTVLGRKYLERLRTFIPTTEDTLKVFSYIEHKLIQKVENN
jgi:hypothetical protein